MNIGKFAGAGEGRLKRERGENPRQDRCCVGERCARCHWRKAEKARVAVNPSQKTCPWIKYQFLRPQERYVLCNDPWDAVCRCVRWIIDNDGIYGHSRYIPIFVPRMSIGTRCSRFTPVARRDSGGSAVLQDAIVSPLRWRVAPGPIVEQCSMTHQNPYTKDGPATP